MRRSLRRPWTDDDIRQLRNLAAAKWSVARIGARLRRTPRVVKFRARLNGIGLAGDHAALPFHEVSNNFSTRTIPQLRSQV